MGEKSSRFIPVAEPSIGSEEYAHLIKAIKSGWISSRGTFVPEFEKGFSEYCGRKYGISTSSGTAALHLALKAIGIKKGDEVIIPALTFISPANAVNYCNAKPVFVDIKEDSWGIDPKKIESVITSRTKAIVVVHLYGYSCDMDSIQKIAKKHKLKIIEDAAEAHGAEYGGKKVGSFGDISCFSFFGNKTITTGEGGMCLTDNEDLAEKIRILRDYGESPGKIYYHEVVGFNYRMTNLQAAIGCAQIKKIDKFIKRREEIAEIYSKELKELEGIITLQKEFPGSKNVYWMYSILVEDDIKYSRDGLAEKLGREGIETKPFFYPVPTLPPYKDKKSFPIADSISKKGLNLPSSPNLKKEEIIFICNKIKEYFGIKPRRNQKVLLVGDVERSVKSTVLTIKENMQNFNYDKILAPVAPRLPLFPTFFKLLIYPFIVLSQESYDVYHVADQGYGHLVHFLPKKKTVVTCHDLIPLIFKSKVSFIRRFLFKIYLSGVKRARFVLVDSENTKKDLIRLTGVEESRIRIVPNCIDFSNFKELGNKQEIREREGLNGKKTIMCFGPEFYKNIPRVLEAFSMIREKHPETMMIKIGEFSKDEMKIVRKFGLENHIVKKINIPEKELVEMYNCADVVVYPNLYAGFSRPPFEAMSCGTPVVTSKLPFMEELDDKESLLIVDPYSANKIAEAILSVFENPSLRKKLIEKSKIAIEKSKNSIKRKCSTAFSDVYKEV